MKETNKQTNKQKNSSTVTLHFTNTMHNSQSSNQPRMPTGFSITRERHSLTSTHDCCDGLDQIRGKVCHCHTLRVHCCSERTRRTTQIFGSIRLLFRRYRPSSGCLHRRGTDHAHLNNSAYAHAQETQIDHKATSHVTLPYFRSHHT